MNYKSSNDKIQTLLTRFLLCTAYVAFIIIVLINTFLYIILLRITNFGQHV